MTVRGEAETLLAVSSRLEKCAQDLPRFHRLRQEYMRGGLPGSSIPEAISRSSEPGLPMFDADDKRLRYVRKRMGAIQHQLVELSSEYQRLMNSVIIVAPPVPDEVEVPCVNTACGQVLEEGRKSGECGRCRKWRQRKAAPYPYEQAS